VDVQLDAAVTENWSGPSLGLRLRLPLQLAEKAACNVTFELETMVVSKEVGAMQLTSVWIPVAFTHSVPFKMESAGACKELINELVQP